MDRIEVPALDPIVSAQPGQIPGSQYRSFRILVTSESTGLIETIVDTLSVHSIKKAAYAKAAATSSAPLQSYSLYDHFVEVCGA
jgi:hypothetical protein